MTASKVGKRKVRSWPYALDVHPGEPFGAGYRDEDVLARAEAEATARLYDPGVWGTNRVPFAMCAIARAGETAQSLQGHQLDAQRAELEAELEGLLTKLALLNHEVLSAIGDLEAARLAKVDVQQLLDEKDLSRPEPQPGHRWAKVGILGGLAVGEGFVLTPAFQVLGLSDRPLFWFVSAQHLAALSGIVALLVLAHGLAEKPPEGRKVWPTGSGTWREEMATRSDGFRINVFGAVAALFGLATVREAYLSATGDGNAVIAIGFLLLNLAVVLAARWAARPDSRPYAAQWQAVVEDVAEAETRLAEARAEYEERLGEYNALRVQRDALISQYDHATAATRSDANRQIVEFGATARLGQPEPVTEPMFDTELPAPAANDFTAELRAYLLRQEGVPTRYQRYERLDTTTVEERHRQMEQAVAQARRGDDSSSTDPDGDPSTPDAPLPRRRRRPPAVIVSGVNGADPS